tara:strand:+ start:209 stop:1225 length:1017 start_codon:yes stop_codon:yes gene_type:complete
MFENKIFIVAELSANHGGSLKLAKETVKAAKRSGADAIKLQTFRPNTITLDSKLNDFLVSQGTIWDGRYLYDLYEEAHTPWEWHEEIFNLAKNEGLVCFSTPFDKTSVDFLENLNNPIYKIASCEITDLPLIKYVASKKKPIIISTGIANKEDIELAVKTIRKTGNNNIVLLKCTTSYPAPLNEANLLTLVDYKNKFNVIPGISDHTLGITAPIVAASLGARVIEKHFILNRDLGGPDASFSLNEEEFKKMVNSVRETEKLLGNITYDLTEKQIQGKNFSRSLYVVNAIKKGEKITEQNVKSIRPGYGLHPKYFEKILGKRVNIDLLRGERMELRFIS